MARKPGYHYKFDASYSEKLIKHMTSGKSIRTFAAVIGVCRNTVYEWLKAEGDEFDEFRKARDIGDALSELFWEEIGIAGTAGKLRGFNANSWKFNMQNRFHENWNNEKTKVEVSGNEGAALQVQLYLPDNGRDKAVTPVDEEETE